MTKCKTNATEKVHEISIILEVQEFLKILLKVESQITEDNDCVNRRH